MGKVRVWCQDEGSSEWVPEAKCSLFISIGVSSVAPGISVLGIVTGFICAI